MNKPIPPSVLGNAQAFPAPVDIAGGLTVRDVVYLQLHAALLSKSGTHLPEETAQHAMRHAEAALSQMARYHY